MRLTGEGAGALELELQAVQRRSGNCLHQCRGETRRGGRRVCRGDEVSEPRHTRLCSPPPRRDALALASPLPSIARAHHTPRCRMWRRTEVSRHSVRRVRAASPWPCVPIRCPGSVRKMHDVRAFAGKCDAFSPFWTSAASAETKEWRVCSPRIPSASPNSRREPGTLRVRRCVLRRYRVFPSSCSLQTFCDSWLGMGSVLERFCSSLQRTRDYADARPAHGVQFTFPRGPAGMERPAINSRLGMFSGARWTFVLWSCRRVRRAQEQRQRP